MSSVKASRQPCGAYSILSSVNDGVTRTDAGAMMCLCRSLPASRTYPVRVRVRVRVSLAVMWE